MKRLIRAIKNPTLVLPHLLSASKEITNYYCLGKLGYSFLPKRVAIGINSICNMRCIMCDIGQGQTELQYYKNVEKGATIDLKTFQNLIDELKAFSPMISINLTEPLLHKEITKLTKYIVENQMQCEITTNGYLLPRFAREFVEIGLPQINISIDGPPKVHNKIRGVSDSFERAFEGIQRIIEAKVELKKPIPKIRAAYAISNLNCHCLCETAEILKDAGVDTMTFTHLNFISAPMAKAHNSEFGHICKAYTSSISMINPEEMDTFTLTNQIKLLQKKYPGFASLSPSFDTFYEIEKYYKTTEFISKKRCFVPWRNAQILPNGDVIPASRCFHIIMGNIYQNKWGEIWSSENYRRFRRELRKVGTTPACWRCCGIL